MADVSGNAQRIDPDSGASTLLTSSGPGGKYTRPVHYDQVRTLTIAERKRLQGVPDDYVLYGRIGDVGLEFYARKLETDDCRRIVRSVI
jgi:site-specific DNA-cytosine methylase